MSRLNQLFNALNCYCHNLVDGRQKKCIEFNPNEVFKFVYFYLFGLSSEHHKVIASEVIIRNGLDGYHWIWNTKRDVELVGLCGGE